MNFIETIYRNLHAHGDQNSIVEIYGKKEAPTSARQLHQMIARARTFLSKNHIRPGDRVVLIGPNSTRWAACDFAILAEGAMVVPLYNRQEPRELAQMVKDCAPKLVITSDIELATHMENELGNRFPIVRFDSLFTEQPSSQPVHGTQPNDPVTIIYTSGTSGEPKGVILTRGNVDYMLKQTISSLEETTGRKSANDHVFHFLPWCFAGSRIMFWTQLLRGNPLLISTDLKNLAQEIGAANPNYYLNVPALLERVRTGVGNKVREKGGIGLSLYTRGEEAFRRLYQGKASLMDRILFTLAKTIVFSKIKKAIGSRLEFLICGSAPLSEETQRWFEMVGIRVLQVYGLTETTAIVTMDRSGSVRPGYVGMPIDGCEVKLTADGELICRGPNNFAGYWNKPEATAAVLKNGWIHTGDQAEIDEEGHLKIVGRLKNLIIPISAHKIAPEPLEQKLLESCPGIEHVVIVGNDRPYLTALVTGEIDETKLDRILQEFNDEQPHYRKIKRIRRLSEHFTVENGFLTANQKLRRQVIETHFQQEIEKLYGANA